jgi:hypothetical protein
MGVKSLAIAATALLAVGCAGLMMDVKEADEAKSKIALQQGDQVSLAEPDVKYIEEEFGKEDAERVAKLLKADLAKELAETKVTVSPDAEKKIYIKVTNFEKGCGFCRGFFPVFGLGDSAIDGEVELEAGGQKRKLIVQKTGQMSGTSQMGDQTDSNAEYFASVVVGRLTGAPEKEE